MGMSIDSINATPMTAVKPADTPAPDSHIDTFFAKAVDQLKSYETKMQGKFEAAMRQDSAVMRMPDYMAEEFKRLQASARTAEERAMVDRFKAGVTSTFETNRQYYADRMDSKIDTLQMKLGAQFVSNTVKGVQQLLSAS